MGSAYQMLTQEEFEAQVSAGDPRIRPARGSPTARVFGRCAALALHLRGEPARLHGGA